MSVVVDRRDPELGTESVLSSLGSVLIISEELRAKRTNNKESAKTQSRCTQKYTSILTGGND